MRDAHAHPARSKARGRAEAIRWCKLDRNGRRAMKNVVVLSRRSVLAGTGALVFSFCSQSRLVAQEAAQGGQQSGAARALPGSLKTSPFLDSWIRVDANGSISVLTGKAELGQGIKTALLQVAAEELDVALSSLTIIPADPPRTPNKVPPPGTHSSQESGPATRPAAVQVRALLIAQAASRFALPE